MNVTVNKVDDANTILSGILLSEAISESLEKVAKQASKEIAVDGFRKGKVPVSVVKKLHGEKLTQDAESEVLKSFIDVGLKDANIDNSAILGEPTFKKYNKTDEGIEVEVEVSIKPIIELEGYMDILPAFEKPTASKEEVESRILEIAESELPYEKISQERAVEEGDKVMINFEGFIGDEAFDGGKAEDFALVIGSNQFIEGFEAQLIGMRSDEEKTITVTFPKEYQSADLAGKEAQFKVKLNEIQEQGKAVVDDALAKKVLGDEEATLDTLHIRVENEIISKATSKLYNEELKPALVQALVDKFDMALPNSIVDQEIDAKVNEKAKTMSEEELKSYKENPEKIETLRDEVREDAIESVKATFLVDALAKKENVSVEDSEVTQMLYYEAMMSQQDPQGVIKYYEENNLLPAVKMGMIEDKVFSKILGLEG